MATINLETYVRQAGDEVKQLSAATKGSKQLQELADAVRGQATDLVKEHLRKENKSAFKGHLDWHGTPINVKHHKWYTWENYRTKKKAEEDKTAQDLQVELELEKRRIAIAKLQNAEAQLAIAQSDVKKAKNNVKASDKALATLLPNSDCIHDDISIDAL